ncbi:GMC oxidoreductase [Hyphomicrobium sulfonivorans]|uniref:GMC oxidoreductase n=1 Tax=Hyphomicrobium sulfonivorans TaxID=121290 RepID=UPI0009F931D0
MFAALAQPESRGRLRLQSADPEAPPGIDANFLSDTRDVRTAAACVELLRSFRDGDAAALLAYLREPAASCFLSLKLRDIKES